MYTILEAQNFRNLLALNFMLIETYFKGYQWGVIKEKLIEKSEAVIDPQERLLFWKPLGLQFALIKERSILGAIPWPLQMAWRETSVILALVP